MWWIQAIYISLFIGGAKSCRYSTLFHISSLQRDWQSVRREVRSISSKPRLEKEKQKCQMPRKRLCESCWIDQNQEMEIESLRIQIILSTSWENKPLSKSKQGSLVVPLAPSRQIRLFFLYFFFLSQSLSNRASKFRNLSFCTQCICVISPMAR